LPGGLSLEQIRQAASEAKLVAREDLKSPRLADLLRLDDPAFRKLFSGSPIKRIGRNRFLRNVLIAAGNSAKPDLVNSVERLLDDPDETVRGTAVWAWRQLVSTDRFKQKSHAALPSETSAEVRTEWQKQG
jgi:epoxyqueuosine reductase